MKKLTVFKNSSNMHSVTRATSTSHKTSVIFSHNLHNFFSAGKRGGGGQKKKIGFFIVFCIIFPFKKGVARYRLKSDRKVQLISNPKYKSVRYVGIHVPLEKKMILEADCSTSPRLKGIFGSMKNQFKN